MARRNSDGKYILSAGEIGAFAVCPESWRLKVVEKVKVSKSESSKRGEELHRKWVMQHEEAQFFAGGVKLIVVLTALAVVIGIVVYLTS